MAIGIGGGSIGGIGVSLKRDDTTSVSRFISKLGNGLARPSRFRCEFTLPMGIATTPNPLVFHPQSTAGLIQLADIKYNKDETINIFCHTATLPMRSMNVFQHRTNTGPTYSAPYAASYEPVTLSFYADKDLNTRQYFDIWQQAVTNVASDTNNYWNEFVSDVKIFVQDTEGNDGYSIQIIDAWPANISSVDVSYGSTNTVLNVSVTLQYRRWKANVASQTIGGIVLSV